MGCNYLSLSLIPASDTIILICQLYGVGRVFSKIFRVVTPQPNFKVRYGLFFCCFSGSVPLRRGRDNAVAVQWRWPAAVAPRSCSQESGSNALLGRLCRGPARSAGFWIGFAWYHETPFLPTNAAGRAVAHSSVSAMVTLMTFIYFK